MKTFSEEGLCKNSMRMNLLPFLLILLITKAANADTTTQTTSGPIRGTTVASGKIEAFLGIPYAEPPVGPLRLKRPVPKAPWEDVYDANQLPNSCIQSSYFDDFWEAASRKSEDCLYLNLWVPRNRDTSSKRMPIIIWIHGGGFMVGSSSLKFYDGSKLAQQGNIIVASINYRLGGLGFFTGFIDDAPGNMGMYDQVAAIQWIKENAEHFQGDPNNIVLMGESAGSFSVSAHLLSPLSKNLFKRAILLSGTILHPIYTDNNDRLSQLCQEYATVIGCTVDGETLDDKAKSIVECMKELPAEKFSEADTEIMTKESYIPSDIYSQILFPLVGDDFLPENTIDSFRKGNFKDTEIFIGITRDEGSSLTAGFTPDLFGMYGEKVTTPFFNETSARQYIRNSISSGDESENDRIVQSYMDRVNEEEDFAYVKALSDAVGDYMMNCGAVFQAEIQSLRNNPVYFYIFDFLSPSANHPKWMGVPHGDDVQYVFGNFIFNREYSELEKEFSRDLMDRLAAFARTGNPNIPKAETWPRFTFEDKKYLVISQKDTVKTNPGRNRCDVWRKRFRSEIDEEIIKRLKKSEM